MKLEPTVKNLFGIFKKEDIINDKQYSQNNEAIEVTLLSASEINDETSIFQKIIKQKLPNSIGATGDRKYWLRDSVLFHKWSTGNEAQASYVENDFINYASTAKALGVRPIIKHPNLKEFLQNTNITLVNNIETAIIGEFPNCNLSIEIFNPFTLAKFKPTGKTYTLLARKKEEGSRFHLYDCPEYIYDGQKFVEFDFQYFLVEPVKFYIDKTNNMLISKKVLFDAPININSTDYDGNFETSQLYNYLNGWFIKNLVPELKTGKQLRKE